MLVCVLFLLAIRISRQDSHSIPLTAYYMGIRRPRTSEGLVGRVSSNSSSDTGMYGPATTGSTKGVQGQYSVYSDGSKPIQVT